jgi:hypothetical protein
MAAIFRRPQFFEKSGFACFSKNLASCIQFLLNAVWYQLRNALGVEKRLELFG